MACGLGTAASLFVLAGCSSLPTIVPDLARNGPPVQLEGARGELSVAHSQAILERLKTAARTPASSRTIWHAKKPSWAVR